MSRLKSSLPESLAASVKSAISEWQTGGKMKRLWQRDASLWTGTDEAHWLGFTPLRITSVTFAGGAHAKKWAVVSDYGGTAEVNDPPSRSAPRTAARSASTRTTRWAKAASITAPVFPTT